MRHSLLAVLPPLGAALVSCALAGSCMTATQHVGAPGPSNTRPAKPAEMRIVQLHTGLQARFELCEQPACPSATPKTLITEARSPAPQGGSQAVGEAYPRAESKSGHAQIPAAAAAPRDPGRPDSVSSGTSLTELSVSFASGSAWLSTAARASIDDAVNEPGIARIAIRGRTDSVGPSDVNEALAAARARAVEQYLQRAHPRLGALVSSVDGKGACCYVTGNETPHGRARNRRVEIDIERMTDDP